ncbi:hypothetical protein UFOVP81_25 [uncultured Caudovirales phage]|uniref:Uncharacterized protein n=1 Tax=uncultured Caudovirales phage TaxID=2100421 RepID=A0A6J5KZU2_9CAUD|nr:hypothetical protein UFOVP81_25 [uncultured Caudovirales phage]
MATKGYSLSAFGSVIFDAAASTYITVSSPVGSTSIYYKTDYGSGSPPDRWVLQTTVSNAETTLDITTAVVTVMITAGTGPIRVGTGTSAALSLMALTDVSPHNSNVVVMGVHTDYTTSATLSASAVSSGVIIDTSNTTDTLTLFTGTVADAAYTGFSANDSIDFTVSKIGTNTCTLAVDTGITDKTPSLVVDANSSGRFRLRKTGTAAYKLYRLS